MKFGGLGVLNLRIFHQTLLGNGCGDMENRDKLTFGGRLLKLKMGMIGVAGVQRTLWC